MAKLGVILWAWPGLNEDCGVWGGGLGNPPPNFIKYVMGQRDHSTLSGSHRGNGDVSVAESSTQLELLANESGAEVLEGLRPRLLFKLRLRSRSILLPHVKAGDVHGAASLIPALLVVGALLAPAALVTPAVALRAA